MKNWGYTFSIQAWLRKQVLTRDWWQCQDCGETNKIYVHHILPVRLRPDLRFDTENLRTVCMPCHMKAHKRIDFLELQMGEDAIKSMAPREFLKIDDLAMQKKIDDARIEEITRIVFRR